MSVYRILHYPHVLLRKKSLPVQAFTPDLATFAKSMTDTMYAFEGIGLAARGAPRQHQTTHRSQKERTHFNHSLRTQGALSSRAP